MRNIYVKHFEGWESNFDYERILQYAEDDMFFVIADLMMAEDYVKGFKNAPKEQIETVEKVLSQAVNTFKSILLLKYGKEFDMIEFKPIYKKLRKKEE